MVLVRSKGKPGKSIAEKKRGPRKPAGGGTVEKLATAAPLPMSPKEKLLDAAERLLIEVGHDAITTRLVSREAGMNQGLVHYHYGSMEELFLAVLERFTARLIVRQRAMYSADTTFLVKWRKAMGFLEEDLAAGYPKIWLELQAMGWNRPEMRTRIAAVHGQWCDVLTEAFGRAMKHYGIENGPMGLEAMVALVATFNQGIMLERLSGVNRGHDALLLAIDRWLESLEEKAR
jgi:TetR/AcrR family transcriptional regulator